MWKTVKLGDVCEVLDKLRKPITKKNRVSGEYPYYGATGIVDWVADYIFDERLVLVGEDGAKWGAGDRTAFIAEGKYWVNNHAHVLRPIEGMITHEWLAYYLTSIDLLPWVTGLTVEKLNQARLRSIPIPLPPLTDQHRIAAKLDAVFSEIDKAMSAAERKREQADNLKHSILAGELSPDDAPWKTVKLKEICTVFADGDWIETKDQSKEGIRLLQTGNIRNGNFANRLEKARFISHDTFVRLNCTEVLAGDILVSRLPDPVGRACIVPPLFERAITAVDCTIIRLRSSCVSDYINYFMQSPMYFAAVQSKVTGATRQRISRKNLGEVPISLPLLPDQHRIVAKLDAAFADTAKLTATASKQIENYRALKSAILARELQSEAT